MERDPGGVGGGELLEDGIEHRFLHGAGGAADEVKFEGGMRLADAREDAEAPIGPLLGVEATEDDEAVLALVPGDGGEVAGG